MGHRRVTFCSLVSIGMLLIAGLWTASAAGQTYTVLYRFAGTGLQYPTVFLDPAGNLYGMAQGKGTCTGVSIACGVIFTLTPNANGTLVQSNIHIFGGPEGSEPTTVQFGPDGNLYGTTNQGGAYGLGTVYMLSAWGGTAQVLYNFPGGAGPSAPIGQLHFDSSGNVYVATFYGGTYGTGVLFELSPVASSNWHETDLYSFDKTGDAPVSELVMDAAGNFYGNAPFVTYHYNYGRGLIYEISPGAGGVWSASVIFPFQGARATGINPGPLTIDSNGNLYGTTWGYSAPSTGPVAFMLAAPNWTETILRSFTWALAYHPQDQPGPVTLDAKGNVYGTVENWDYFGDVTYTHPYDAYIYRLGPSGSGTYYFPSNPPAQHTDVNNPVVDAQGNVYGTAYSQISPGVVFKITF